MFDIALIRQSYELSMHLNVKAQSIPERQGVGETAVVGCDRMLHIFSL